MSDVTASQMTSEQDLRWSSFVEEAKRLKKLADDAEKEFMEFLYAAEQNEELWRPTGAGRFVDLLVRHEICAYSRYNKYKETLKTISQDTIDEIGLQGAYEAAKIIDTEQREECVQKLKEFKENNGVYASKQTAEGWRKKVQPMKRTSARTPFQEKADRVAELEAENQLLRARITELEQENFLLKAELNQYQNAA